MAPHPKPIFWLLAVAVMAALSCGRSPEIAEDLIKLSKRLVLETSALHTIRKIHVGDCHPSPGTEIVIVGYRGALLIGPDDRELATVEFASGLPRPEVVDVTGDGRCEFYDRGWGWLSTGLLDHDGEVSWSLTDEDGLDDVAAGDLDNDGIVDFVIGMNGRGGLRRHDHTGRLVWRVPDSNVDNVEIVDIDGDGRREIVHNNARRQIRVRDEHGKIVKETTFQGRSVTNFSIVELGTPARPHLFFGYLSEQAWIADFDGSPKRRFSGPQSSQTWPATVQFQEDGPVFIALLFRGMGSSMRDPAILQVYDEDDNVVFREEYDGACGAIAAVPRSRRSGERLWVACAGQVWEYSI